MKKFVLVYELALDLDPERLWPPGYAPPAPTVEEVRARVLSEGGPLAVIRNLAEEGDAEWGVYAVGPNGSWLSE